MCCVRVRVDHRTDERRFQLSAGPTGRPESIDAAAVAY